MFGKRGAVKTGDEKGIYLCHGRVIPGVGPKARESSGIWAIPRCAALEKGMEWYGLFGRVWFGPHWRGPGRPRACSPHANPFLMRRRGPWATYNWQAFSWARPRAAYLPVCPVVWMRHCGAARTRPRSCMT
jgi:hypothetical protein